MVLLIMWLALAAYAVLAGADFGAGIWDLLAGPASEGRARRKLIEHVIGPVWEANHVWLIFVMVLLWTCYPPVFAAIASTLYIPLTLVAFGIIGRGAAFAFRKVALTTGQRRLYGAVFAASSLVTPFFLGAVAGAVASDRVPAGIARGAVVGSWLTPISMVTGALAVSACALLAAVYLTGDARAAGDDALAGWFRRRALASGVTTGILSAAGLLVARTDAPALAADLAGRGGPLVAVAGAAGTATLALVWWRRYLSARVTVALAVAAVLFAWGVGRYPHLMPGLDADTAAALPAAQRATLITVAIGAVILLPSMIFLFTLFQRSARR